MAPRGRSVQIALSDRTRHAQPDLPITSHGGRAGQMEGGVINHPGHHARRIPASRHGPNSPNGPSVPRRPSRRPLLRHRTHHGKCRNQVVGHPAIRPHLRHRPRRSRPCRKFLRVCGRWKHRRCLQSFSSCSSLRMSNPHKPARRSCTMQCPGLALPRDT